MDLRKAFATDKRAETEGRKLVLEKGKAADGSEDTWLLIARKGNANHKAILSKLLDENRTLLNTKTPEAELLAQAIFREASAKAILIGWSPKGIDMPEIVDENGVVTKAARKDMAYSYEAAKELLEMDDFNTMVDNFADSMANYRAEEVVKDAKNSKAG